MRIIAGTHRGRPIVAPRDKQTTRPITDRVKEAVFNRIASLGMLEEQTPWHAVDVFSGTGSLGLESLSRGAASCTFVDQDRDAIDRLNQNLDTFGFTERTHIVQGSALAGFWTAGLPYKPVRLVFVDPPYPMMRDENQRGMIVDLIDTLRNILEPGGLIILRTPREIEPGELPGYDGPINIAYGKMRVHIYQQPLDASAED